MISIFYFCGSYTIEFDDIIEYEPILSLCYKSIIDINIVQYGQHYYNVDFPIFI